MAKEFNTIAVDDGIAMGHDGMLYSAAEPRPHRRQRRVHGQRPLRRRDGVHLQLRQDHPGHADGRAAAQRAGGVRLGRADGGRQSRAPRQGARARPGRRDGRRRRRADERRGRRGDRALGVPDLRLVLGDVHRQLDELPDRGARALAAGQRLAARHPCRPQAAVRARGAPRGHARAPLLRGGRRERAAARDRRVLTRSRTP